MTTDILIEVEIFGVFYYTGHPLGYDDPSQGIMTQRKTITLEIQQVTECGYFVMEHAKQKNLCQLSFGSRCLELASVPQEFTPHHRINRPE